MKIAISKAVVLVVAKELLEENTTTTTLEVKQELRKRGFDARQSDTSNMMAQLGIEENWDVDSSGLYKIYAFGPARSSKKAAVSKTVLENAILKTKVSGCWEMNSVTSSTVIYVDGNATRDEARAIYTRETGISHADTRGRKVK